MDNKVNILVRATFGPRYTVHVLRSLYAHLAYEDFGKGHLESQTAFFSRILGHKENSLTTALSYQKFSLQRDLEPRDPSLPAQLANLKVELRAELLQELKPQAQAQPQPQPLATVPQPLQLVIQKQPRKRDKDVNKLARMWTLARELTAQNIRVSNNEMRRRGFGSRIAGVFMRQWRLGRAEPET